MTVNKGYPPEFVERVRTANNIVDVAKSYLPLKQKGQDFWACCPFHHEKTPSFAISNPKQFYYCYGCHQSGNVFSLVMKMENLSWPEAVAFLAKKANIALPETTDNSEWLRARQKKEKIYAALQLARDYYNQTLFLPQNAAAREYLARRGIDETLIKMFHLGYSDSWGGVLDALRRQGVSEQTMKEAGIVGVNSHNGRVWDAQFERVVFPIHDVYGNCLGFTGRTLKNDPNLAKYKNTADTLVFNKSNIVYGIDVMKEQTRGQRYPGLIVVEGNVDEIAMVKHGFPNTVACMGTALTKFHANLFARFGSLVYLCLDGDSAGEKAALKSIPVLQNAGLSVRVVFLPNGQDPDEFLTAHGPQAMQECLDKSMGGVEFKLFCAKKHSDLSDRLGKADYLNKVVAILAEIPSEAERELYLREVAENVGVDLVAVRNTVNDRLGQLTKPAEKPQTTISSGQNIHNKPEIPKTTVPPAVLTAEKTVAMAVAQGAEYAKFDRELLPEFTNPLYQKIITTDTLNASNFSDILEPEEQREFGELLAAKLPGTVAEQAANFQGCLNHLKIRRLSLLKNALPDSDIAGKQQLQQQINQLKQQKTEVHE